MASVAKRPASVGVADDFDDGPMDASCVMINLANDKPRESHQGVMYFPSLNVAASLRGILGAGINFHLYEPTPKSTYPRTESQNEGPRP